MKVYRTEFLLLEVDGKEVNARIDYKDVKRYSFYPDGEGGLRVSAPRRSTSFDVRKTAKDLEKGLSSLLRRTKKVDRSKRYLFGMEVPLDDSSRAEKEENKALLEYVEGTVRHYEGKLGIEEPYRVRVRKMKTRLGSNSRKTHTLTFSTELKAYHPRIIDSVVVHELCHHYHFDHGKEFNALLRELYPEYDACRKKLRKGEFTYP